MGHDLRGRRIVVGGGTGDVGVEIVAALLEAGADVIAVVRSRARADALGSHDRLHLVEGFPSDDASVEALRGALAGLAPLHGSVAALGPWHHGPGLVDLPVADWDRMIAASVSSHYLYARAVVPQLAPGGQYILINGAAAHTPIPHSGIVSIVARAQTMIADVLAAEHPGLGVHTLMLRSIIATRARPDAAPEWITARQVGEACSWILTPQGRLTAGSTVMLSPPPGGPA